MEINKVRNYNYNDLIFEGKVIEILIGNTLASESKHFEAIEIYNQAIKINSKKEEAYLNKGIIIKFRYLGSSLADLNKHYEAIECYDLAIEINPNMEEAYLNKGRRINCDIQVFH